MECKTSAFLAAVFLLSLTATSPVDMDLGRMKLGFQVSELASYGGEPVAQIFKDDKFIRRWEPNWPDKIGLMQMEREILGVVLELNTENLGRISEKIIMDKIESSQVDRKKQAQALLNLVQTGYVRVIDYGYVISPNGSRWFNQKVNITGSKPKDSDKKLKINLGSDRNLLSGAMETNKILTKLRLDKRVNVFVPTNLVADFIQRKKFILFTSDVSLPIISRKKVYTILELSAGKVAEIEKQAYGELKWLGCTTICKWQGFWIFLLNETMKLAGFQYSGIRLRLWSYTAIENDDWNLGALKNSGNFFVKMDDEIDECFLDVDTSIE